MFSSDIRRTLCGIIREHGPEVCEPPTRVRGFLNDLCPEEKADINLLMTTLTACRLAYFQAVKRGQAERLLALKINSLHYDLSITKEAAHWAVETWALALGVVEKPLPRPLSPPPEAPPLPPPAMAAVPSPALENPDVPLTPYLPETPLAASVAPPSPSSDFPAFRIPVPKAKGVRSPKAILAGVAAAVGLLFLGGIAMLTGKPNPPALPSAAAVPAPAPPPADLPASPDPAAGREQALAERIEEIRSGLEQGTTLVWPLDGKDHGMKIILPPVAPGDQNFLMGHSDIHQGCEFLQGQFRAGFSGCRLSRSRHRRMLHFCLRFHRRTSGIYHDGGSSRAAGTNCAAGFAALMKICWRNCKKLNIVL